MYNPVKVSLLYFLLGILWIFCSDSIVNAIAPALHVEPALLQMGKGFFFILSTSIILFITIDRQQKILLNSERQFKNIFYSNSNPLWIYDSETLQFIDVNEAAIRVYGYSRDEFKKMTILDIRPKEDIDRLKELVKTLPEDYHVSGSWEHIKKNGKRLTVSVTSHRIKFNGRTSALVMAQDITMRLKQEIMLKESYRIERQLREELSTSLRLTEQSLAETKRLAEIVDRISNMVMITDAHQRIIWVNKAFCNFTHYERKEVIGRTPEFLQGPGTDPEAQRHITETLQSSDFATFEVLNYTKSGEEYWVELSVSAIYDADHNLEKYIAVQSIITDRKLREEKIQQQNKTLREFAWTNSHAIRKPVASLLGLTSIIKTSSALEEIKELNLLIDVCATELDNIIIQTSKQINRSEFGNDLTDGGSEHHI